MLSPPELRALRLHSLLLGPDGAAGRSIPDVVTWFGAMQAQDLASAAWSLGLRTGTSRAQVDAALSTGAVLRTWPMRGTLHLVPGPDARWMIEHLGRRSLEQAEPRRTFLGFDLAHAQRAAALLGDALADGEPWPRSACLAALEAAGVDTRGSRGYHLLWFASATGVLCVGPNLGKEQSFVLLDRWAPEQVQRDRPAALATIAGRFVRSHGPVTAHDLARWADLTVTDARAGLAAAPGLVGCTDGDGRRLVATEAALDALTQQGTEFWRDLPAHALPGFDELVLGYRDRTAQLDKDHEALVVPGGNGVFYNTLVVAGRVVGTWRRKVLTRRVELTATPFVPISTPSRRALSTALTRYAEYLGLPGSITWTDTTS
ncbi:MAG TPA: winged helix DNA-binding domain-containing protein [Candidatus Nanopelagicales bacterium]